MLLDQVHAETKPVTIDDVRKQFPGAQIRIVSVDEYIDYKNRMQPATAPSPAPLPTPPQRPVDPCAYAAGLSGEPAGQAVPVEYSDSTPSWNFNYYGGGSGGGNSKEFLVVVAVIGVVVVAALVVYSVGYLVEMARSGFQCRAWKDFGLRFSYIQDSSKTQLREGKFTGLYYSLGYIVPFGVMGLTAEVGGHNLKMHVNDTSEDKTYEGAYLLVGPSFSIPFDRLGGHAFQIELLAGTSSEKGIGLISTLRFGIELKVAPTFSLGFNLGAALVNIRDFDNYLKDDDQLNFLTGVSSSYRF